MYRLAWFAALGSFALAQSSNPDKKLEFEVASVHPTKDDGHHSSHSDDGFLRMHNYTLKRLIAQAYDLDPSQVLAGPSWVDSDSYDINAKIPDEFAKTTQRDIVPEMLRSLLADRFQLAVHPESRQVPGFDLVIAKKGSKLEAAKPGNDKSSTNGRNTHLKAENISMPSFARTLSRNSDVGGLVIDKTGLTGGFNFELDWAPDKHDASDDRPSIFNALQEQLGLKLESAKITIQAVVIDKAEKPEAN